jgi:hypothetical protein
MAQGHSPFLQLPPELRLHIYQYLVPTNQKISFSGHADMPDGMYYRPVKRPSPQRCKLAVKPTQHELEVCLPFFLANRMVYNELMTLLYGANNFVFFLRLRPLWCNIRTKWSRNMGDGFTLAFGGEVSAARWLKRCEIAVVYPSYELGSTQLELREGLERFAAAFDDANGPCRLSDLKVTCVKDASYHRAVPDTPMLFLEPLARMRGIEKVEIESRNEAFCRKLESVMMGPKEWVLPVLAYEQLVFKRRKVGASHASVTVSRSAKKYYDPEFDWSW